jgi:DNA invertase Pin-like site-specific DNA recombinase
MGVVVAVYSDVASAYAENAKRPDFEAALDDLRAGRIDGIAVWKVDRLVREGEPVPESARYSRMLRRPTLQPRGRHRHGRS